MRDDEGMRTTLDLDEDVLLAAKELAGLRGKTAGQVISELARLSLARPANPDRVRNGVPLLPPLASARPVTSAAVHRLQDEE